MIKRAKTRSKTRHELRSASKNNKEGSSRKISSATKNTEEIEFVQSSGARIKANRLNFSLAKSIKQKDLEQQFLPISDLNRVALLNYLIVRVLFSFFLTTSRMRFFYSCCNCFCRFKAEETHNHDEPLDSFDLLLDESEQKNAGVFKKKLILKNNVKPGNSSAKFFRSRKQEVIAFLKTLNLKKLKAFVDEILVQKDGFYRLPVLKNQLKHRCPYNDQIGALNQNRTDSENSADSCLHSNQKKQFFDKRSPIKSRSKTPKGKTNNNISPRKRLKVSASPSPIKKQISPKAKRVKKKKTPQKKSKKVIVLKNTKTPKAVKNLDCWSNMSVSENYGITKKLSGLTKANLNAQKPYQEEFIGKIEGAISLDSEKAVSQIEHNESIISFSSSTRRALESKLAKIEKSRKSVLSQLRAFQQKKKQELSEEIEAAQKKLMILIQKETKIDGKIDDLDKKIEEEEDLGSDSGLGAED